LTRPSFEIHLETAGRHGKVLMDGQELKGITGVFIESTAQGVSRLSLDFIPDKMLVRFNGEDVTARIRELTQSKEDERKEKDRDSRFSVYGKHA
jgi:hypothetical protein